MRLGWTKKKWVEVFLTLIISKIVIYIILKCMEVIPYTNLMI